MSFNSSGQFFLRHISFAVRTFSCPQKRQVCKAFRSSQFLVGALHPFLFLSELLLVSRIKEVPGVSPLLSSVQYEEMVKNCSVGRSDRFG